MRKSIDTETPLLGSVTHSACARLMENIVADNTARVPARPALLPVTKRATFINPACFLEGRSEGNVSRAT